MAGQIPWATSIPLESLKYVWKTKQLKKLFYLTINGISGTHKKKGLPKAGAFVEL